MMQNCDVYTDGSFNGCAASWAFVILDDDNIIHSDSGRFARVEKINEMHQVGGEIYASARAVQWCVENSRKASIYFDYWGVRKWISDIFGEKPWRANKVWTKQYKEFILRNKNNIVDFIKVESHSGDKWNSYVDKLCSKAEEKPFLGF